MKRNNVLWQFCFVLVFLSTAFQRAAAADNAAAASDNAAAAGDNRKIAENRDSTFILPIRQADHITVRTSNINLTIRRWADPKAQLVVTAAPADWDGDLLVSMRSGADGIIVEMGPKPRSRNGVVRLSDTWRSIKATLDIPDGHEFVLNTAFANVDILSDFMMGNFTVNNGELTAANIPQLELNTQFAKVHLNDCHTGDITVNNGELTASSIPQLKLNVQFAKVHLKDCHQASITANNTTLTIGTVDILQLGSMFSNIDLTTVNQLKLTSNNDAIEITDLGEATGRKTFGSFRIGKLRKGFSLVGQNADVSIREIAATLENLKVEDQFAQLHIPIDGIPGFSLHFEGMFATVKSGLPRKPAGNRNELNHTEFTMDKGAAGGKWPVISLSCNNCEVDLE